MSVLKLVVLGEGGVGKTALTIQYTQHLFVKDYDPTIESTFTKTVELDGSVTMLDILDTAGQEEYSVMRNQYIRSGNGFVLVYSITSRESFKSLPSFRDQIFRVKDSDQYPLVVCANKADMEDRREVTKEEGLALAQKLNCPHFETSARTRVNVEEAFNTLVRNMMANIDYIMQKEGEMNVLEPVKKNGKEDKKQSKSTRMPRCILS
jgi:GTPase KRas protein